MKTAEFDFKNLPEWVRAEIKGEHIRGVDVDGYKGGSVNNNGKIVQISVFIPQFKNISSSKTYRLSKLEILQHTTTSHFFVTCQVRFDQDENARLMYESFGAVHGTYGCPVLCPRYMNLGEFSSLSVAKTRVSELVKKHIQPLIDQQKLEESKKIIDIHGKLCVTPIGNKIKSWNRTTSTYDRTPPAVVRIGDFVTNQNTLYKGWIWTVIQEDLTRSNPLRIMPVFCGLQQVDFKKRTMCVSGPELEHVDTLKVGQAFSNLKSVVEQMMKMKSGQF